MTEPGTSPEESLAGDTPAAFDTLFSAAPEAVGLTLSGRQGLLRANPAMQTLLGNTSPSPDLFGRLEGGPALRERTDRALREGQPLGPVHVLLCDADGAWHGLLLRLRPIARGAGWLFLSRTGSTGVAADPAGTDTLTGLAGRSRFLGRFAERMAESVGTGAVLLFGIDDLPGVNRALGRGAGDHLMRHLARRLELAAGQTGLVGRIGGDTFGLVLEPLEAPRSARVAALDIAAALSPPVALDAERIGSAISVGIALFPNDGRAADPLLARAETALAEARHGGGGLVSFGPGRQEARERVSRALREAVLGGELTLHYQPIVTLGSGRPALCEALLRRNRPDPENGPAPADLARLEAQGAALDSLRRFTIDEALRQHRTWGRDDLRICVNVSPEQIATDAALDCLLERLDRPGARSALVLEITETARFRDPAQFARLHRLRAAGIALAIDDFGTGFSTLDYLARIPAESLKIDGSFTRGLDAAPYRKLMRAAIALGHDFGMTVIAENVETESQADFLRRAGCDMAQGYAFGAPRPAATWGPHGP
ncbi:MAG: putative bifunctional diguanylate cyclase/phosphodiesterase [Paracoccaceae bacterium]